MFNFGTTWEYCDSISLLIVAGDLSKLVLHYIVTELIVLDSFSSFKVFFNGKSVL